MTFAIPPIPAAFVRAVNTGDAAVFRTLFATTAVVDDVGGEYRGPEAIGEWADKEIFAVNVRFEVLGADTRGETTVLTSKIHGDFDRTGLPDPLVMTQAITSVSDKITALTCRLAPATRAG